MKRSFGLDLVATTADPLVGSKAMRWLGKVIGGTVGLTVGGAAGAVIGGGLGAVVDHALDGPPPDELPEFEAEGKFADDPRGRFAQIQFTDPLPAGAIAVAVVQTKRGRRLGAVPAFHKDGTFLIRRPLKRGQVSFYIPFSALRYKRKRTHVLRVAIRVAASGDRGVQELGQCSFEFPLPRPVPWDPLDYMDALVQLCAAVIHADDVPRSGGAAIVAQFFLQNMDLPEDQAGPLDELLQSPPEPPLEELCKRVLRRLPELRPMMVLGLLAEVARADGAASRRARTVIRDVAEYLGIPGHRWSEVQKRLRLVVHDPWGVLELQPGANTQEIKKAYRTKLKGLHPDRVSGLDAELQELAEARTIELREAYEACLDTLT